MWDIHLRSYIYAGKLLRKDLEIAVELGVESDTEEEEVNISSLDVMPLRYAGVKSRNILEQRAETFWKIRKPRLMSYLGHCTTGKYAVRNRLPLSYFQLYPIPYPAGQK